MICPDCGGNLGNCDCIIKKGSKVRLIVPLKVEDIYMNEEKILRYRGKDLTVVEVRKSGEGLNGYKTPAIMFIDNKQTNRNSLWFRIENFELRI
jgi:hypothetical protein